MKLISKDYSVGLVVVVGALIVIVRRRDWLCVENGLDGEVVRSVIISFGGDSTFDDTLFHSTVTPY